MKIAVLIARILMGLIFVVFGLNGFLHFIPMGPMPAGWGHVFDVRTGCAASSICGARMRSATW